MTKVPTDLRWMSTQTCWYTQLDENRQRFIINRQPGPAERFTLEQVRSPRNHRLRHTTVRQLRNIKTLAEAKRIAAEDWS